MSTLHPIETADESPGSKAALKAVSFLYRLLDCERPWAGGCRFELAQTDEVTIGRGPKRSAERETSEATRRLAITLPTATLSSKHARLLRVGDSWAIQDRGSRNGTWLNSKRIDYAELDSGDVIQVGRSFFQFRRYDLPERRAVWPDVSDQGASQPASSLATLNPELGLEHEALCAIAKTGISVLILGETGTGKELTAKAVHEISGRSGQFCAVNCGAIPSGLVESTLFGHIKGAFTGALSNQLGAIRTADKGTLFLDEIGDLAPAAQTTLLRVLQEREVTPVGTTQAVPVDLRVVAATHQPLEHLIQQGRFRADLYARLAGSVHHLRPLASRLEDFGVIFAQLLRRAAGLAATEVTLTTELGWALLRHRWPLNVRELEQAITRAVALGTAEPLGVRHFPFALEPAPLATSGVQLKTAAADVALRKQLDELMRQHHGNVAAVARVLGKGPTQIQRWLKRVGLVADGYRE